MNYLSLSPEHLKYFHSNKLIDLGLELDAKILDKDTLTIFGCERSKYISVSCLVSPEWCSVSIIEDYMQIYNRIEIDQPLHQ